MSQDDLNEREFELINIVGDKLGANQRDLSKKLSLSLGMTNMLIKRMISKGYIRIRQLNKRKVEYLLTPKGFAEKMRKSVKYTLKTIQSIGLIKDQLKDILLPIYNQGQRRFFILGDSDLALMIELVFRNEGIHDYKLEYINRIPAEELDGILLICKEKFEENSEYNKNNRVSVIELLARQPASAQ